MKTIKEARKFLKENYETGVYCPCCRKLVLLNRKSITSVMAASLIKLVRLHKEEKRYYEVYEFVPLERLAGSGIFAQLVHWGMISRAGNDDETKRASGFYIPTKKGIKFAKGKTTVQKYIHTYNNAVIKTSGEQVTIEDSLRNKFNFQELWK